MFLFVTVTPKPKSVLPEKPVDRYPGPFRRWVRSRNHRGMAITVGKATTGNVLPVVVVRHVTSYRTSGRGRTRSYVTVCIISQGFISSCTLIPESLFVALAAGALEYSTSQ